MLKEISDILLGQSPKSENYTKNSTKHILIQGNADLRNGKIYPRIYTTEITKLAQKEDIIFTVRAPVGEVAITDKDVVIGRGTAKITGNKFIYFLLQKIKQENGWKKYISGSTFESITGNDLKNTKVYVPETSEQKIIYKILNKLDYLLALYERKSKLLSQIKEYLLDNLFAENEYPNLRFKGFTNVWEQRKLKDIVNSYSGGTPNINIKKYYSGNIPFIRSSDIHKSKTKLFLSENGIENSSAKYVYKGQILYALYGATSGQVDIAKLNGAINQAVLALDSKTSQNKNQFIYYLLLKKQNEIVTKYLQGGQGNLSAKIIKNITAKFPNVEEQEKIFTYVKNIDDLITLYESKLKQIKQIKKELLDTMFV